MAETAIKMKSNTWASDKRRLGLGTIHQVPAEVSAEDAKVLVDIGKAEWATSQEPSGPVPVPEIVEAIGRLNKNNPDHFTKGGVPQVKAIEAQLGGRQITAKERDAALAAMAEGHK